MLKNIENKNNFSMFYFIYTVQKHDTKVVTKKKIGLILLYKYVTHISYFPNN